MGRPPLSENAAKAMTTRLIRATRSLILSEGLSHVTIRKIGDAVGMNSASMYKFFADLDELLLFACVDVFKSYTDDLYDSMLNAGVSAREEYLTVWSLFCKHAFLHPECMNHLFFSRHSKKLEHIIREYYDLFPEQLEGISDNLQLMLRSADFNERNLEVLRPLFSSDVPEERVFLISDLTISYFKNLLDEKISNGAAVDNAKQAERMLSACKLLISL